MKKIGAFLFPFFILLSLTVNHAFACTTFCLKNGGDVLFGKNYDWMIGDGFVFVNKRGVEKTAIAETSPNPAKWISQFGSVTFNQYGRENPSGGMNEKGLVIELMWLDDTQYPKADERPTVGTLEWIQYQLDNSASVEDVIKNSENIRIASEVKLHYLVNDKQGNSATVEFLNGKLVAHTGEKLAFSALTNDTYEKSLNYKKSVSFEKAKSESSFDRFTRAAEKSGEFTEKPKTETEAVKYAFDILENVKQKHSTQWSIVYDQRRGKIHFRSMQSPTVKTINANAFDYDCGSTVKMFDINSKTEGDISGKFSDYTREANRDLIEHSFTGTPFLKSVPAIAKDMLAAYPENFVCSVKSKSDEQARRDKTNTAANYGGYFAPVINAVRSFANYLFG
jgi:penicillin V acylase-like amidase (Ntn superfamily)